MNKMGQLAQDENVQLALEMTARGEEVLFTFSVLIVDEDASGTWMTYRWRPIEDFTERMKWEYEYTRNLFISKLGFIVAESVRPLVVSPGEVEQSLVRLGDDPWVTVATRVVQSFLLEVLLE